jgi:hypothetical protein
MRFIKVSFNSEYKSSIMTAYCTRPKIVKVDLNKVLKSLIFSDASTFIDRPARSASFDNSNGLIAAELSGAVSHKSYQNL